MKNNPKYITTALTDNPVAKFSIDGMCYLVFPQEKADRVGPNPHNTSNHSEESFEGDLRIGNNRYSIALTQKQPYDVSDTKKLGHPLSKREWDIVTHVAEGYVNKQIADMLHISEWTVSTHMRRIFAKLGVDSRAAMVYKCSSIVREKMEV